jgi:peptidoglycan/LPS O-acetylase OafA/YrhL
LITLKRIPSLDGFRAVSIILVLIAHSRLCVGFPAQFADVARHGRIGVTVFFVISGFLITSLLLNEYSKNNSISISGFYTRRALRILPVFILYTTFILTIGRVTLSNSELLHTYTFTGNFDDPKRPWYIFHLWTLSVEEQFYLFWPAIFILFRKFLKPTLFVFIIYSCITRVIAYKFPEYATVILAPYFAEGDAIMIGALGGILLFENPSIIKHKVFSSYLLQLAALILIGTFVYLSGYGKLAKISLPFGNTVISFSILFLIFSYITPSEKVVYKVLNSKVMVHIGVLSYSIYIWQQYFMSSEHLSVLRFFPLNILTIYLVSFVSYYLWESRFLKLKQYLSKGGPVAEPKFLLVKKGEPTLNQNVGK